MQETIDLTKPLTRSTRPYQNGAYKDPPFKISGWCRIREKGFWVSKLEMGTQTGTHIDAPAHFLEGAETLEKLDISTCFGPYFLVHLGKCECDA
ncbi:MAG: cyclase family protein, partial [bacterium]